MESLKQLQSGNIVEISVKREDVFPGDQIFKLFDTKGFPVADSCQLIMEKKMCIDWDGFITEARKAGWKDNKIQSTILNACIDLIMEKIIFITLLK